MGGEEVADLADRRVVCGGLALEGDASEGEKNDPGKPKDTGDALPLEACGRGWRRASEVAGIKIVSSVCRVRRILFHRIILDCN
jgi:hypothetical protein